jgi:hypothetical protein
MTSAIFGVNCLQRQASLSVKEIIAMPNTTQSQNFAPDGFTAQRPARTAAELKNAVATASRVHAPEMDREGQQHCHNQDGFDEGLVHSHGWACSRH